MQCTKTGKWNFNEMLQSSPIFARGHRKPGPPSDTSDGLALEKHSHPTSVL